MVTNITIMDSFIKQDYTQGSSSTRKKLVAICFHITVHSDESAAVAMQALSKADWGVWCSVPHQVLLRHPLQWLMSKPKGSVFFGENNKSSSLHKTQCSFLFNGKLHYFLPSASSRCTRLSVVICFYLGSSQDRVTARTSNPENRSLIIFQSTTVGVQKARGTFKIPRHNLRAPLESKICN